MKSEEFTQFDDPRVREVMAAAANLAEALDSPAKNISEACSGDEGCWCDVCDAKKGLKTALFAAQHSKPKVWPCPTKPGKTCMAAKCDWGCKT